MADGKIGRSELLAYALAKRRAEIKAKQDIDNLCERFESINAATVAEIRALRSKIARMHAIDDALAAERDETRWLH